MQNRVFRNLVSNCPLSQTKNPVEDCDRALGCTGETLDCDKRVCAPGFPASRGARPPSRRGQARAARQRDRRPPRTTPAVLKFIVSATPAGRMSVEEEEEEALPWDGKFPGACPHIFPHQMQPNGARRPCRMLPLQRCHWRRQGSRRRRRPESGPGPAAPAASPASPRVTCTSCG